MTNLERSAFKQAMLDIKKDLFLSRVLIVIGRLKNSNEQVRETYKGITKKQARRFFRAKHPECLIAEESIEVFTRNDENIYYLSFNV